MLTREVACPGCLEYRRRAEQAVAVLMRSEQTLTGVMAMAILHGRTPRDDPRPVDVPPTPTKGW